MLEILLVDDSEADARLITLGARRANIANPIRRLASGEEALEFLESDEPLPGLMLLDLSMPMMNGHEVLRRIRGHVQSDIRRLPVVILTTSDDPDEVAMAYDEQANSYVVKPVGFDGFRTIMTTLSDYWFGVVESPVQDSRLKS